MAARIQRHVVVLIITAFLALLLSLRMSSSLNALSQVSASTDQGVLDRIWQVPLLTSKTVEIPTTIGYAVSITACEPGAEFLDGAAVLYHSIELVNTQKYQAHIYAFLHPAAKNCTALMTKIGYDVKIRETPVLKEDIQNQVLQNVVSGASCCGEKEFLKLYSYTLVEHPVVVHLDLDSLMIKPLDEIFDAMLASDASAIAHHAMWTDNETYIASPRSNKGVVNFIFTRDYNMVNVGTREIHQMGVQGGLLIVKTNMQVFEEYRRIIISGGNFTMAGWGGDRLSYGGFYGAAQVQGIMSYYYGHLHPHTAVELNRCHFNAMVDNPRDDQNRCRTLEPDCEDCRDTPFEKVYSAHFTLCGKPWWCPNTNWWRQTPGQKMLCDKLHQTWFRIRFHREHGRFPKDNSTTVDGPSANNRYGYCNGNGPAAYTRVAL